MRVSRLGVDDDRAEHPESAPISAPISARTQSSAMEELSEYEKERLEHIKRNHEMLVRLGLVSSEAKPLCHFSEPKTAAPKRQKKMLPAMAPESLRRSSRVAKLVPEYNEEKINAFGDDDREVNKSKANGKGKKRAAKPAWDDDDDDDDDDGDEQAEILASTTAFLKAAREALLQFVSSSDGQAPDTSDGWHAEAVKRWGAHCGKDRDWESFVSSRLSKPPPPSPHDLLQEYYAADMWQLLCCCVLMSRVSSWATKHRCISAFFSAFPTPSDFLESVVERGEHSALKGMINSLGLFDDRLKGLVAITEAFLLGDDEFMVDLKEHKIKGIGEFGYHSWLIFCRDAGASLKANDAALSSFCAWRKKSAAAEAKQEGGAGAGKLVD